MKKVLVVAFGVVSYICFLGAFLYLLAFLGNFIVPKTVDAPVAGAFWPALLIDVALVAVFGLQHSVMARPTFKHWWTRFVPKPVERSTYVMFTNLALIVLFWQWRPMGGVIWNVEAPAGRAVLYSLFAAGWLIVLVTTFLINHFDLFGLRQVWLYLLGKEYTHPGFVTPGPYKYVRHPLYVGWLLAFWATPTMTAAHLAFAAGMTAYILVAIIFEERNLAEYYGLPYVEYRQRVGMLLPKVFGRRKELRSTAANTSTAP